MTDDRSRQIRDQTFAGGLIDLPSLRSKVSESLESDLKEISTSGCSNLYQFNLHGHVDGEEHLDGVRVPQDQGVL